MIEAGHLPSTMRRLVATDDTSEVECKPGGKDSPGSPKAPTLPKLPQTALGTSPVSSHTRRQEARKSKPNKSRSTKTSKSSRRDKPVASSKKGRSNKRQHAGESEAADRPPAPEEEISNGGKGEVAPLESGRGRENVATTDAPTHKSRKGGKRRRSGSGEVADSSEMEMGPVVEGSHRWSPPKLRPERR